jgi:hypothetical protein
MTTSLNVLFPDITEVDVSVAQKGQVEYLILQQFGFSFEANQSIDKAFYKIDMDCNQASGAIYSGNSADASGALIFNALKDVTAKYLVDVSNDETVDVSGWSESGLNGTADASGNIGQQILKGVLGPMLSDTWGSEAIANPLAIYNSGNMGSYNPVATTLDHKIAAGLASTINNAIAPAHDEVIGHLLDQVKDASGSIANDLEAARALGLVDASNTSATGVEAYANQVFWMKVYLDVAFDGTPEAPVTDYEDIITPPLDDDDDEGDATDDNKANLVKKTATSGEDVTMNALQPGFLDAFKGHVKHSGTTTVDFGSAGGIDSTNHGIADDAVVNEVRIPLLVKFTVGA